MTYSETVVLKQQDESVCTDEGSLIFQIKISNELSSNHYPTLLFWIYPTSTVLYHIYKNIMNQK